MQVLLGVKLVLAVFVIYRLSRLVAYDEIMAPLRLFCEDAARAPFLFWLCWLIGCPYCTGLWFALFATWLVLSSWPMASVLLIWLGLAGAQDFIESVASRGA